MDLMKVSDFCRKYKLAPHRFSRYKYAFKVACQDGYSNPWVIVNEANLELVKEILQHTGTRPKKQRLTYDAYKSKYNLTSDHFQKVWHRLQLEENEGQMLIVDTRQNYALLKHGRLIRKKM